MMRRASVAAVAAQEKARAGGAPSARSCLWSKKAGCAPIATA